MTVFAFGMRQGNELQQSLDRKPNTHKGNPPNQYYPSIFPNYPGAILFVGGHAPNPKCQKNTTKYETQNRHRNISLLIDLAEVQ
jgi:hypothetical protein